MNKNEFNPGFYIAVGMLMMLAMIVVSYLYRIGVFH